MGGLAGITSADGWLIAALGISVVFLGLACLALILSCLPRMIGWWNAQSPMPLVPRLKSLICRRERKVPVSKAPGESLEEAELDDAEETLRLLTAHLGEPFKLPRLLMLAEHRLAKSHSTICRLILKGKMVREPDGLFRWAKGRDT